MKAWLAVVTMGLISLTFAISGVSQAPVVVLHAHDVLKLPEGKYQLSICPNQCTGLLASGQGAVIGTVAGSSSCPAGTQPGTIHVSAKLTLREQRKVIFHEVVHIAVSCDKRTTAVDERIAEDIAALCDDPNFSQFILIERH